MFRLCFILILLITKDCLSQDEDEGPYKGKLIGKLNSYHHQVSGEVYAVDEWTILLVNFNYDGTGDDTFFWAGDSGRPGPQGFIIPDQNGKTNILERYHNEEVRLRLPEGKRVSRLKWVSVYDIGSQNAFADVFLPDEFTAPAPRALTPLSGGEPAVTSGPLRFLDASTLLIPELRYDGSGEEVYFWTGAGPQPSARGHPIPDEYGYLEPLRAYLGEDVVLRLAGGESARDVSWVALWDAARGRSLAAALVPDALLVPPAPAAPHPYRSALPHCKQLHRELQVSWEVFGNQITIELAGQIGEDEYMAFGVSGAQDRPQMVGADVAVAYFDTATAQGHADDYNITDKAPCVPVLGEWRGVCRDSALGALDSNQVFSASRHDGLTVVRYRRELKPTEPWDLEWSTVGAAQAVWALGALDRGAPAPSAPSAAAPSAHRAYPRAPTPLRLAPPTPTSSDCVPFTVGWPAEEAGAWPVAQLFDPALRVLTFTLGPAGGRRGLAGRARPAGVGGAPPPPLAWYVNGQLAPELQLVRGRVYSLVVRGGDDPHSPRRYHPLVVTEEPRGGLDALPPPAQRRLRVLAGARHTRRDRLAPTAAGPLCVGERAPGADPRRDDQFPTFRAFNRSLAWRCESGPPAPPAALRLQPNNTWPDLVYYHSFTHAGMGGRIYIVDKPRRDPARRSAAPRPPGPALALLAALALTLLH